MPVYDPFKQIDSMKSRIKVMEIKSGKVNVRIQQAIEAIDAGDPHLARLILKEIHNK